MSRFRRIEVSEPSPSLIIKETTTFFPSFPQVHDDLGLALDFLTPNASPLDLSPQCFLPPAPSHCELFDFATDIIQIERTPVSSSCMRFQTRTGPDSSLRTLCDRVSALELGLDRFLKEKTCKPERRYSWTAEIKDAEDGVDHKYKWTAELKGKGKEAPVSRSFTFKASTALAGDYSDSDSISEKEKKKRCKAELSKRVVEIEEPVDQGALIRRQVVVGTSGKAFAKRFGVDAKGKRKELLPQDAAMMIQMTFRAYLIRRSKALRAHRELAVAKGKLKEIRALFNNFSYHHLIACDAAEHQRFSEKIIVLLLTVDTIEGADLMVRAARRSILDELEAMLDVVDPQPSGKLGSIKRRKFDLREGLDPE